MITLPVQIARRASQEAVYASYAFKRGALGIDPPWKVAQLGHAAWRYGLLGAVPAVAALRHGRDRAAVLDELGTMTYGELDDAANALANHWRAVGLTPGDGVSILARNHRWFLVATYAAARCGTRIVLLNTDFAGPQIRDVAAREGTDLLVHDDEYGDLLADVDTRLGRIRAWTEDPDARGDDTIAGVVARGDTSPTPRSGQDPKVVLLTSGTTGTPKGAPRAEPRSLAPIGALLSRVPFNAKGVVVLPAPMFHTLGFAQALLNGFLGSTLVVRRRFDPVLVLEDLSANRATGDGRRTGDAAEDGRARRRGVRRGGPLPADGHLRGRVPARRRARDPVDGAVRSGGPQHVRLHRGRLRDHRHARGPGGRARLRRAAGDGCRGAALRRRRARGDDPRRRSVGSSSATTSSSRATPAAGTRTGSTG